MQPNQQASTDTLQGNASSLQQQDTSTQYQQTGGVGQDALGPEKYQNLDNLSVQGTPTGSTSPAVTAGNNSPEMVLLIIFTVVIIGIVVIRKFIFKPSDQHTPLVPEQIAALDTEPESASQIVVKSKKKKTSKKSPSKVKKPTKKAKKSGKK